MGNGSEGGGWVDWWTMAWGPRTRMSPSLYMAAKCGIGKIPGARFS